MLDSLFHVSDDGRDDLADTALEFAVVGDGRERLLVMAV